MGYSPWGREESDRTERTAEFLSFQTIEPDIEQVVLPILHSDPEAALFSKGLKSPGLRSQGQDAA